MICVREDGTCVAADLGPGLPYHDLAHWVVERAFGLQDGFFGHIARGYTPAQLSDKAIILSLGKEPYRAEILARALGSLETGACSAQQFEMLINAELSSLSLSAMRIGAVVIERITREYHELVKTYDELMDGGSMEMSFETAEGRVQRPDNSLGAQP